MNEQQNRFTYRGTVHELLPLWTSKNGGFRKRDIVCRTENGRFIDYALFTAKGDTCEKLDALRPGDNVEITFVPEGRKWEPDVGQTRWFGGCVILRIEGGVQRGVDVPTPDEPTEEDMANAQQPREEPDEMQF